MHEVNDVHSTHYSPSEVDDWLTNRFLGVEGVRWMF